MKQPPENVAKRQSENANEKPTFSTWMSSFYSTSVDKAADNSDILPQFLYKTIFILL